MTIDSLREFINARLVVAYAVHYVAIVLRNRQKGDCLADSRSCSSTRPETEAIDSTLARFTTNPVDKQRELLCGLSD